MSQQIINDAKQRLKKQWMPFERFNVNPRGPGQPRFV